MSKKTRKAHMARYVGHRNSVSHTGNEGAYNFRREVWIEVDELDAKFYEDRAKSNDTWEYEEKKVLIIKSHHYAKWLGVGLKTSIKFDLYDKDVHGNINPKTHREYVLNKGLWVLVNEKDTTMFQQKAQSNDTWEFETVSVPVDIAISQTVKDKSVQEFYNKQIRPEKYQRMEEPKDFTDEEVLAPVKEVNDFVDYDVDDVEETKTQLSKESALEMLDEGLEGEFEEEFEEDIDDIDKLAPSSNAEEEELEEEVD